MLSNYYKTALRSMARSPFYAVLDIAGLSLGFAFTLLIGIFCWSELRVNRQLRQADRQYILTSDWKDPNLGYPLAAGVFYHGAGESGVGDSTRGGEGFSF
jgi:hypothetical protein